MSSELNDIELRVIEKLLQGDHPTLDALRKQFASCLVRSREWTGAGFYTDLQVGANSTAVSPLRLYLGDVFAEIEEVDEGMGFILNVTNGYLDYLEGYTFEEKCPKNPKVLSVSYINGIPRDLSFLGGL